MWRVFQREAADRYTRIIFFSFWSFVVVMRVVIIIFIFIRDIKIRGADAAATPKRKQ